jgi:hypothetical protein
MSRGDRIRTCDPLVPNQVLYQAEPLPDAAIAGTAPGPGRTSVRRKAAYLQGGPAGVKRLLSDRAGSLR